MPSPCSSRATRSARRSGAVQHMGLALVKLGTRVKAVTFVVGALHRLRALNVNRCAICVTS